MEKFLLTILAASLFASVGWAGNGSKLIETGNGAYCSRDAKRDAGANCLEDFMAKYSGLCMANRACLKFISETFAKTNTPSTDGRTGNYTAFSPLKATYLMFYDLERGTLSCDLLMYHKTMYYGTSYDGHVPFQSPINLNQPLSDIKTEIANSPCRGDYKDQIGNDTIRVNSYYFQYNHREYPWSSSVTQESTVMEISSDEGITDNDPEECGLNRMVKIPLGQNITYEDRIKNCRKQYDAVKRAANGKGYLQLVARKLDRTTNKFYEVWYDADARMLWSDVLDGTYRASESFKYTSYAERTPTVCDKAGRALWLATAGLREYRFESLKRRDIQKIRESGIAELLPHPNVPVWVSAGDSDKIAMPLTNGAQGPGGEKQAMRCGSYIPR